ncbi:hypothetical protein MASR1M31_08200 [Porphyromonadaceae bacterium]
MDNRLPQPQSSKISIEWFESHLNKTLIELDDLFDKYRLNEALMLVYKLFWDDFSAYWYLEDDQTAYQSPIDGSAYKATRSDSFDSLLRLVAPFMPFITEELWQR